MSASNSSSKKKTTESAHLSIERTVAFLLDSKSLEAVEHAHLSRCTECKRNMAAAASEELSRRQKSG
jgi:hypothetical protein